jgi:site-specific DNA recombinase
MEKEKLKYVGYARKSSEDKDSQILSIESQTEAIDAVVQRFNLSLAADCFKESMSAKKPGRPVFGKMMKAIRKGDVNAIICWKPDRLARNFIDGGEIIHLLSSGVIKEIRTPDRVYLPSDNVLMLAVEFGMSSQFIKDLSSNVKRGLRKKASMGFPSGVATIGFLNDHLADKGTRRIFVDPQRFPLVQQLLKMFASGKYSVSQLLAIARNDMKLMTLPRKREGGRLIVESHLRRILANPFYCGYFYAKDISGEYIRYELNKDVPRAISEEEYEKIQRRLVKKGKPRSHKRAGLYNEFMSCGACGGTVIPDFKFQIICPECKEKFSYPKKKNCPRCGVKIEAMKDPIYYEPIYYYCMSGRKRKGCYQRGGVEEKKADTFTVDYLTSNVSISRRLSMWAIEHVKGVGDEELEAVLTMAKAQDNAEQGVNRKLQNLLDLRIGKDNQSPDEVQMYNEKENTLRKELAVLKATKKDYVASDWFENATKEFDLMAEIEDIFQYGTREEKKDAFREFGSNLTMNGKKLNIINAKEVQLFVDALNQAKQKNDQFEPKKTFDVSDRNEVFSTVRTTLCPRQESNPHHPR